MKKVLALVLASVMVLGLAGCAAKAEAPAAEAPAAEAPATEAAAEAETEAAAEEAAAKEVLTMATEATFPPYEFYDGDELVGIDVEIAKAIADKLGMDFEVTDIAFDSIIPGIQEGKYMIGAAGMTVTEERLEEVNFTESYATGIQVVITKEGGKITSIDDLFADGADTVIGTQTGTTGFLYSTWDIEDAGLGTVKSFAKTTDAVEALKNDQVDCVMLDNEPAKALVAENEGSGLYIIDSEYAVEDYAIAMAKDNTELLEKVNGALIEMKEDGTLDDIVKKYIGE